MSLEDRLEKLERLIYGTTTTDGLLSVVIATQNDLKNVQNQLISITQQINSLDNKLDKKLDAITKQLRDQPIDTDKKIEEINKKVDSVKNFVLKIAATSAAIGFAAGVLVTLLLH